LEAIEEDIRKLEAIEMWVWRRMDKHGSTCEGG